jgi:hypothetical protein
MQGTHFPPECYVPEGQRWSLFRPFRRVQWDFIMEKFVSRSLPTLTTESRTFGCGRRSTYYGIVPPRFFWHALSYGVRQDHGLDVSPCWGLGSLSASGLGWVE